MAFYRFVRTADDVADHATLSPGEKLASWMRWRPRWTTRRSR
jgi:phytoene/squalene synthetase